MTLPLLPRIGSELHNHPGLAELAPPGGAAGFAAGLQESDCAKQGLSHFKPANRQFVAANWPRA
jgi:hypothetical protein